MAAHYNRVPRYRLTWPMVERGELQIITPLSPLEMNAMLALLSHRVISSKDLIEAVWPDADTSPEWTASSLSILVRRLKDKGVAINHTRDIGYRLARPDDQVSPQRG